MRPSDEISCWFIDDDDDDESYFLRQAYFLGGATSDPNKALKSEIDEEPSATLHTTRSHPVSCPTNGRISVKEINHFGAEVQKVFTV